MQVKVVRLARTNTQETNADFTPSPQWASLKSKDGKFIHFYDATGYIVAEVEL